MNSINYLLPGESRNPRLVGAATSPQFANNHKLTRVRMKGTLDKLVGYVWTIVITGIDVVYTGLHRFAQNSNGAVHVPRWSPDSRAGKLHCTVTHSVGSH